MSTLAHRIKETVVAQLPWGWKLKDLDVHVEERPGGYLVTASALVRPPRRPAPATSAGHEGARTPLALVLDPGAS